jgi:hypothetical protein
MAKTTNERLADLIKLLGSNRDGEVVATARAIQRVLKADGRDLHSLADTVARNGARLSESEMRKLYDAGFAAGVKHTATSPTFHNVEDDGLYEMAQFVWERADRLHRKHRGFAEGMVKLAGESELSTKQKVYLKSLYRQLGGK